ncbi:hypothetical protein C7451_104163 [Blastomonas natatoria]|uniref:Uncharacterized protein n=1 Tax=Blastomonas natatoria TaxID=34015 RepID=A0A2V3VA95_9SPHN|nr:hypothetical protein [Blastomonas natatoria]PXW77668.1 hypothetical protein C7451_104163 [Blastomonas natatoria]
MARKWPLLALLLMGSILTLAWPRGSARAEPLAFSSPRHTAGTGRIRHVQADLARTVESWQGTDCHSPGKARAALRPALANWLGYRMIDRPGRQLVRWGYHSGDIWHEVRIVARKRQCRAGFRRLIVFAEFR